MENKNIALFFDKLNRAVQEKLLLKLVLSSRRDPSADLRSIIITMVVIKKGMRLNFTYRYLSRDITKNYEVDEGVNLIRKSLADDFFNADLFSAHETVRLLITLRGKVKLRTAATEPKPQASFSHDRVKERLIAVENNIYLRELGVVNSAFEIRHEMNDKYRQINRYIELIAPVIKEVGLPGDIHIADMGSGKGYLTFALYDYLTNRAGKTVFMTGVESRKELVKSSNELAAKAGYDRLRFIHGAIGTVPVDDIDILIALHACDTATDDAIFRGIQSGASLIVVAPCCHKQLRKEFHVENEMKGILKHGILEERQAEILTDGIRALIMEAHGYKTNVFEFIATEHTPKNLMIVGRKTAGNTAGKKRAPEQTAAVQAMFGIGRHYLEGLFGTSRIPNRDQ
jgi:hypothetical protein